MGGQNKTLTKGGNAPGKPNKVEDFFDVTTSGPSNGTIKLILKPTEKMKVGDEIKLNARLTSPFLDLESIFYVKIVDPKKTQKAKTNKKPKKLDTPQMIKIFKNQKKDTWEKENKEKWNESGWNEKSIIKIFPDNKDGKTTVAAIAVNMSSDLLEKYIQKQNPKGESETENLKSQYMAKIYLHGLFLYSTLEKIKNVKPAEHNDSEEKTSEEKVAEIFKSYAEFFYPHGRKQRNSKCF